jgi:hypothetical protein
MAIQLERVLQDVRDERLRQALEHGSADPDEIAPVEPVLGLICGKLGNQAKADLADGDLPAVRRRLVQIAALAVAAVEGLDRGQQG